MESYGQEFDVTIASVNQAIQSQNKEELLQMADQLKEYMNKLSDDIKGLKDKGRKMKRLEYDMEDVLDDVDNLQIKLDAETSSPNPDQEKMMNYTNEKEELNKKHKEVERKVKQMKEMRASTVKGNETLEIKNENIQECEILLQRIKDTLDKKQISTSQVEHSRYRDRSSPCFSSTSSDASRQLPISSSLLRSDPYHRIPAHSIPDTLRLNPPKSLPEAVGTRRIRSVSIGTGRHGPMKTKKK